MWQVRCTDGFHPPDMARQSACSLSMPLTLAIDTDSSRLAPMRLRHLRPGMKRHVQIAGGVVARVDERRDMHPRRQQVSAAVRWALSVLPNTTTLRPGLTRQRLR